MLWNQIWNIKGSVADKQWINIYLYIHLKSSDTILITSNLQNDLFLSFRSSSFSEKETQNNSSYIVVQLK